MTEAFLDHARTFVTESEKSQRLKEAIDLFRTNPDYRVLLLINEEGIKEAKRQGLEGQWKDIKTYKRPISITICPDCYKVRYCENCKGVCVANCLI